MGLIEFVIKTIACVIFFAYYAWPLIVLAILVYGIASLYRNQK